MILVQRMSEELLGLELTSSNLWPDGRGCHEWNFNGFICYQTQNRHWSWKTESESSIDMGNLLASKEQKVKLLRPSWRLLCRHLISGGSCNTSASRERSFLSIRKSTLESAYRLEVELTLRLGIGNNMISIAIFIGNNIISSCKCFFSR